MLKLTKKQKELMTKNNLKKFRKEGLTYNEIAKKIKINTTTLYYHYWKYDLINHTGGSAKHA